MYPKTYFIKYKIISSKTYHYTFLESYKNKPPTKEEVKNILEKTYKTKNDIEVIDINIEGVLF